jgi:hypothetical protein
MGATTQLLKIRKGAIIVQEASTDSEAYLVHSGLVEVFHERGGRRLVLARLGPGQVFGEMALILERPRTASVVAVEDTVVERFGAEAFCQFYAENPNKLLPFLQLLLERFRSMDRGCFTKAGFVGLIASDAARAPALGTKQLVLSGLTPQAKEALAQDGNKRPIRKFPFRLGRRTGQMVADIISFNDLFLADGLPFSVSRNHCSINQAHDGGYFIRDRGSTLGTIVNGLVIGGQIDAMEAPLDRPRNELILGSSHSPFRFEVVLA